MTLTAMRLGRQFGMTGAETNVLLRTQGFLEGEPGAYRPTHKAQPYTSVTQHSRGTGGSLMYNAHWEILHWEESITQVLDLSPEAVRSAKLESKRLRLERAEQRKVEREAYYEKQNPIRPTKARKVGGIASALAGQALIAGIEAMGSIAAEKFAGYTTRKLDEAAGRKTRRDKPSR